MAVQWPTGAAVSLPGPAASDGDSVPLVECRAEGGADLLLKRLPGGPDQVRGQGTSLKEVVVFNMTSNDECQDKW